MRYLQTHFTLVAQHPNACVFVSRAQSVLRMILVASWTWTGSLLTLWGVLCITGCLISISLYPADTEAALFLICDSDDGIEGGTSSGWTKK